MKRLTANMQQDTLFTIPPHQPQQRLQHQPVRPCSRTSRPRPILTRLPRPTVTNTLPDRFGGGPGYHIPRIFHAPGIASRAPARRKRWLLRTFKGARRVRTFEEWRHSAIPRTGGHGMRGERYAGAAFSHCPPPARRRRGEPRGNRHRTEGHIPANAQVSRRTRRWEARVRRETCAFAKNGGGPPGPALRG